MMNIADCSFILKILRFNAEGLVPVIAQQWDSGEVLMLAWMNEEALRRTLATGQAHYFSRSRGRLWRKGETSGHYQQVRECYLDCDGDTLLLKVAQEGVACHTGRRNCFFQKIDGKTIAEAHAPLVDPETLYGGG